MPQTLLIQGKSCEVATEEELLEFANAVRKAGGSDPILELFPSYAGDKDSCLIANALNFESSVASLLHFLSREELDKAGVSVLVDDELSVRWGMLVRQEIASMFRDALSLEVVEIHDSSSIPGSDKGKWIVVLPEHIGNAALAFDKGIAFQQYDLNCLEL